jgi:dTDP-4-dehydrorhamnose 3,5-epimerase
LIWNDPAVGVEWPTQGEEPILSPKDAQGKLLSEIEVFESPVVE